MSYDCTSCINTTGAIVTIIPAVAHYPHTMIYENVTMRVDREYMLWGPGQPRRPKADSPGEGVAKKRLL